MVKSFYDLDYIIEINEQRLEQYTSAYQKVLERLTNIILIYSAITIFLVPVLQDIFFFEIKSWCLNICFGVFLILFVISIIFTIKLVIPVEVAYLEIPKRYYQDYRLTYERHFQNQQQIEMLLKASYINELETALDTNEKVFRRKSSFYYNALMYALLCSLPYIICLGFHLSKNDDKVQKVDFINPEINRILHKIDSMSKDSNKTGKPNSNGSMPTTTKLPGVDTNQVISSLPKLVKENSQFSSTKKK
ncbi:MAG: hypothetical protein ACXVBR_15625 [Flavisolibacter sp.]